MTQNGKNRSKFVRHLKDNVLSSTEKFPNIIDATHTVIVSIRMAKIMERYLKDWNVFGIH